VTFLKFSRNIEAEADYLGLQYMYKTGYDPSAFIDFFEKIQTMEKRKPGTVSKLFATHPPTDDRIAKSQKEIADILKAKPEFVVTTSEFNDVKARLAMLENQRRPDKTSEDPNKPTLRRNPNSNAPIEDETDPSKKAPSDDDRPKLKRRPSDAGTTGSDPTP
jgi:predicted Zn-dependent protease